MWEETGDGDSLQCCLNLMRSFISIPKVQRESKKPESSDSKVMRLSVVIFEGLVVVCFFKC